MKNKIILTNSDIENLVNNVSRELYTISGMLEVLMIEHNSTRFVSHDSLKALQSKICFITNQLKEASDYLS